MGRIGSCSVSLFGKLIRTTCFDLSIPGRLPSPISSYRRCFARTYPLQHTYTHTHSFLSSLSQSHPSHPYCLASSTFLTLTALSLFDARSWSSPSHALFSFLSSCFWLYSISSSHLFSLRALLSLSLPTFLFLSSRLSSLQKSKECATTYCQKEQVASIANWN